MKINLKINNNMKTTENPLSQEFQLEGVKHISVVDAYELIKNKQAIMIDVRETFEVQNEYVPLENVLNHPMPLIPDRLNYIDKNQNIIVACPHGVRSAKIVNLLNQNQYLRVANLDGGFEEWEKQGLPFETNLSIISNGCGCGCGCNTNDESNKCC